MSMSELERITKKVEVIRKRQRIRRMIEENLISETQGNEMLSRYKKNEDDSDQDSETEEETANDEFGLESMRLAATFSRKDYNKFLETAGQQQILKKIKKKRKKLENLRKFTKTQQ